MIKISINEFYLRQGSGNCQCDLVWPVVVEPVAVLELEVIELEHF
jgi:hypothetical protein